MSYRNFIQFQTEFLIAIFCYFQFNNDLRIHWRLSAIIKTNNKSVWSNVFWYVTVFVFWKCIQYAIHWDKTQMLKKIPFGQTDGTLTDLFFFHKLLLITFFFFFFFDLRFLYELKHKVRLSKTVCAISIFNSVLFY